MHAQYSSTADDSRTLPVMRIILKCHLFPRVAPLLRVCHARPAGMFRRNSEVQTMKLRYTRPEGSHAAIRKELHAHALADVLSAAGTPTQGAEALAERLRSMGCDDLAAVEIAKTLAIDPDRAHDSEIPVGGLSELAEYELAEALPRESGLWTPDQRRPVGAWAEAAARNVGGLSHWRPWDCEGFHEHAERAARKRARHGLEFCYDANGHVRGRESAMQQHASLLDPGYLERERAERVMRREQAIQAKRGRQQQAKGKAPRRKSGPMTAALLRARNS